MPAHGAIPYDAKSYSNLVINNLEINLYISGRLRSLRGRMRPCPPRLRRSASPNGSLAWPDGHYWWGLRPSAPATMLVTNRRRPRPTGSPGDCSTTLETNLNGEERRTGFRDSEVVGSFRFHARRFAIGATESRIRCFSGGVRPFSH